MKYVPRRNWLITLIGLTPFLLAGCKGSNEPPPRPSTGPNVPAGTASYIEVLVAQEGGRPAFEGAKAGDTVKVKGECVGLRADGRVVIHLAKRYHGYRPNTPAPELVQAYAANAAAADKKYRDRVFVVEGVLLWVGPHEIGLSGSATPRPPATPTAPRSPLAKVKPDFSLTAEQLHDEYAKDGVATQKKYEGKVLELTGVIHGFGLDFGAGNGDSVELLAGKAPLEVIPCWTAEDEPWTTLAPGQKVRVRGKWPKATGFAALEQCVIVEKGSNPAIVVTAELLAREYVADPETAGKNYKDKPLLVTGEVTARERDQNGWVNVVLKGPEGVRVVCSLGNIIAKPAEEEVKVGMPIQFLSTHGVSYDNKVVRLGYAWLIYEPK